ncbi:MAG: amino acid permease [Sneathiella sp.]|nr:MAG: amino acid permease [Sneathiella sp.]
MISKPDLKDASSAGASPQLKRSLSLPLLTLYGLGVTIGAGIYVLVGATAAKAGIYAPISFLLAAAVVAFTGFSYSELSTRYPVSAGEAEYVAKGLKLRWLSVVVGLMVVASGVVSSAAISIGAAAYLQGFIPLSLDLLTALVVIVVGLIAAWGVFESVMLAAILTVIEICGLGLVVYYGVADNPDIWHNLDTLIPPFEGAVWSGILSASLLAFFAFVGFEDMANIVEEVKQPRKNLPRGILMTLGIATLIYFTVVAVVVLVVPMTDLTSSAAPLRLVFETAGTVPTVIFGVIAIFATINGVLIQIIMASRVLYGLASQKNLHALFAYINPVTQTPLVATFVVVGIILFLAYFLPIARLAETTSTIVLIVFCFVNLSLLRIKLSKIPPEGDAFIVPVFVPVLGLISSALLLSAGIMAN